MKVAVFATICLMSSLNLNEVPLFALYSLRLGYSVRVLPLRAASLLLNATAIFSAAS